MKIRLINCTILIAFQNNISLTVIAPYLSYARLKSRVWLIPSPKNIIGCNKNARIKFSKNFLQNKMLGSNEFFQTISNVN